MDVMDINYSSGEVFGSTNTVFENVCIWWKKNQGLSQSEATPKKRENFRAAGLTVSEKSLWTFALRLEMVADISKAASGSVLVQNFKRTKMVCVHVFLE